MGFVRTALLAGAAAVWATGAWADTLNHAQGFGKSNVTYVAPSPANPLTQKVSAGAFQSTNTSATDTLGLGSSFVTWCLDLANTISDGKDYQRTNTPFAGNTLSSTQKTNITRLFDAIYDNPTGPGSPAPTFSLSSSEDSAAFQAALWELAYDGTPNSVAGGDTTNRGAFYLTDAGSVQTKANLYLSYVLDQSNSIARKFNVVYLETTGSQDLVTVEPVPLPAGLALMLGGIGALVAAGRRRKRNAA